MSSNKFISILDILMSSLIDNIIIKYLEWIDILWKHFIKNMNSYNTWPNSKHKLKFNNL